MRAAIVVADVVAEHMLGVTLAAHDDVVQAVPAKGADRSFAKGVRLRGSRRRGSGRMRSPRTRERNALP